MKARAFVSASKLFSLMETVVVMGSVRLGRMSMAFFLVYRIFLAQANLLITSEQISESKSPISAIEDVSEGGLFSLQALRKWILVILLAEQLLESL